MARVYHAFRGCDISFRSASIRVAPARAVASYLGAVEHRINGDSTRCLPHVVNVSFPGLDNEALMMALRYTVAVSNGSACTSASYKPSHVLKAMDLPDEAIESAIRISWGRQTIEIPGDAIVAAVQPLRS